MNAKGAKEQKLKILSIRRERRRTKGSASFCSLRGREDLNPLHQPLRTLPTAKTRVALRWSLLTKQIFFAPLRPLRTKHKNIRNPSVAVSLKIRKISIIRCVKKNNRLCEHSPLRKSVDEIVCFYTFSKASRMASATACISSAGSWSLGLEKSISRSLCMGIRWM